MSHEQITVLLGSAKEGEDRLEAIRGAAAKANLSVNAWVKQAIDEKLAKEKRK